MITQATITLPRRLNAGWLGVAAIALIYAALYASNLILPLGNTNHMTRIWDWSQMALAATAGIVLILKRRNLTLAAALTGLALAAVSGLSHAQHDPSPLWSGLEGAAVWLCFTGGTALFRDLAAGAVPAFRPPLAAIGRSLAFGALVALPLAALNNLYFYLNAGAVRFQNVFASAFEALSPATHEEIIFRFFVLALCLYLLRASPSRRWVTAAAVALAVVPHSLNHLPDLFLQNPPMGLAMLAATSLLFGLPMALLQLRRNLETAIAFHWLIDFVRFLFGF
ncbi:type II CAAX prenyl endopeptidase Rce1 family protein [Candidatus Amarolinea aalborgensis]|jgi:hypothetical protein|uniref:CPBP family glutamic-type intramembrane protease n=1 Tax=Candidatus Amarolinea aalborgensis TaxID=2249329 RepID=UPI003BF97DBA